MDGAPWNQQSALASSHLGWALEQDGSFHTQDRSQPVDHCNAGTVGASLEGTDIRAVNTGLMCQCFL
jgi:hypothetical protein